MSEKTFIPASIGRRWRVMTTCLAAALAMAMVALVVLVHHQRGVDQQTRAEVERSYVLRLHLQHVISLVQDVETGARGFMITGQDVFLQPYDRARAQLPEEMAQLRASTLDPQDGHYVAQLDGLVDRKLEIATHNIELRRNRSLEDAVASVRTGQGKKLMDQIRGLLASWDAHEQRELDRRLAEADAAGRELKFMLRGLAAGVLLIITLGGWGAFALARSRDQATAANQAKSAFLAMMSHELRTPLNGVLGMAHALTTSPLDQRQRGYVEVIEGSGQSLLAILNDILDLSKIEAGRLEIEAITYPLTDLLHSIVALWDGPVAEKGLVLTVEFEHVPAWVVGDPTRLRQILTNLLSNALKFTDRGEIRLSVRYGVDQRLRFEVTDTGAGMSPAVLARLFRDFSQGDASIGRKYGGTGLGLSISRRLCRMMGGDLEAESVEGSGSTFVGSIEAPAVTARVETADAETQTELPQLRILAVDDNASNRAVIEALLHALGLSVTLACDGADALNILRSVPTDLVLMDINMPVMNGLEALAAIRSGTAGDPCVRVVALTAEAMAGDGERYVAQGFDGHLSKPIQPTALVETLVEAVQSLSLSGGKPVQASAVA
jgi:signal transduction histidine kinase/ActR/RegA family two-component response regulator